MAEAARRIREARREKSSALSLGGLGLQVVPESIGTLSNLEKLNLARNWLITIPGSLAALSNLRILILDDNILPAVPETIGALRNLLQLHLSVNQITEIPDWLSVRTDLEVLGIGANQIRLIPKSLADLPHLTSLDLTDNRISAIPAAIRRMKSLATLKLDGNPLGIPEEILESHDAKRILQYYFVQRVAAKPLNEAKLILVGRGGVGKTSLVLALTTGKFDPKERTTEGIKISDWACTVRPKNDVAVHIWDFGGQEMMHATHQFFLTARSLYLLVLNRRQDDSNEELEYWLRMIRAFGGKDAPVIVVLNKQKEEPFDVNQAGWREKYPDNIKAFVRTDCADTDSLSNLADAIREQFGSMESLKAQFPTRWFAIKERLGKMKTDYVTFDQYRAICAELGEEDQELQTALSGYLHDLGIALNYRDDPRLRFAYVLKPEWVTDGIYALLHAFVASKGLFTATEAERALAGKKYSVEATHFILGLMEKFELSFALGDAKRPILIPQLLDDQQPPQAGEFVATACLNFGYRYPVIPGGLLPRFIVRTRHLSEPVGRWKTGVILNYERSGCRALVRADAVERQVRIHIDGPADRRRDLLAIVRHNFDVIHSEYEFKPEDLVYPPGAPTRPLVLDELETLKREGDSTISVVLPDRKVIKPQIGELLKAVDTPKATLKLFLSYAHADKEFANELRKSLRLMERSGLIKTFYDRELTAGEKWEARILQELNGADVIVLQISRNFLASDFCMETELPRAIQRKLKGEAELIACILSPSEWNEVDVLAQFQVLPPGARPLSQWKDPEEYWLAVTQGIRKTLEKLQAERKPLGDSRSHNI